jgi:hypothetical protein
MANAILTVRELRHRWKPRKEALSASRANHPTCIRLHRAFSWLARCEADGDADSDLALICLWIAFNALYGQWNDQRREPQGDRECWRGFLDRLIEIDDDHQLSEMLTAERNGVMGILDDEYLSEFFWEEPGDARAGKSKKAKYDARTWYVEGRWGLILERLLERIYVLRCQLIHGAATHGGKLNRVSLDHCVAMMKSLLNAVLLVLIDHGGGEDWGSMCYPPLNGTQG